MLETVNSSTVKNETAYIYSTESNRLFEWLVTTYYIPLELWYTRTSIDKARLHFIFPRPNMSYVFIQAHRLSDTDHSQSPAITTTPDDVFYILKIVISRLLSTGSATGVEQTFEQLRDVMERDYIGIIKKKLDDVYRSTGTSGPAARGERVDRENRVAFIVSHLYVYLLLCNNKRYRLCSMTWTPLRHTSSVWCVTLAEVKRSTNISLRTNNRWSKHNCPTSLP